MGFYHFLIFAKLPFCFHRVKSRLLKCRKKESFRKNLSFTKQVQRQRRDISRDILFSKHETRVTKNCLLPAQETRGNSLCLIYTGYEINYLKIGARNPYLLSHAAYQRRHRKQCFHCTRDSQQCGVLRRRLYVRRVLLAQHQQLDPASSHLPEQ